MARSAGSGGKKIAGARRKAHVTEKSSPVIDDKTGNAGTQTATGQPAPAESAPAPDTPPQVAAPRLQLDQAAPAPSDPVAPTGRAPQAMAEALARGSSGATARKLAENIERIEALGQRLVAALAARSRPNPGIEAPGPDLLMTAANAWFKTMSEQPGRVMETRYPRLQDPLAPASTPDASGHSSSGSRPSN